MCAREPDVQRRWSALNWAMAAALLWAAPAAAQEPIVALNPTTLVGTAGVIAAGEYARKGKGGSVRPTARHGEEAASTRKAKSVCSNLDWYARQPRATPEKIQKMAGMCHRLGY